MPTTRVNEVELHYEVDGSGPPMLVLHGGLGIDHQLYRRTLSPLAEDFQLVFYDHRGNGRSSPVDMATVTMEQLADDAVGLADALQLPAFTVFGHSYGGFVAQELALRHGNRINGLILADTTPGQLGTGESAGEDQGPPPPAELLEMMSAVPGTDEQLGEGLAQMLPYYLPGADLQTVGRLFEGTIHRVDVMVRGFEVLAGWSSVDRLHQITTPTIALVGRNDYFTSAPQSARLAGLIPDAEVVVLENSGHFPWIQEPDAFFAAVRDWTSRKVRN